MTLVTARLPRFWSRSGVWSWSTSIGHYWVARWLRRQGAALLGRLRPVRCARRVRGADRTEWVVVGAAARRLREDARRARGRTVCRTSGDLPRAFNRQTVWKRIAIVLAGPVANLLLAVAASTGSSASSVFPSRARWSEARRRPAPAARAGLRSGDTVRRGGRQPGALMERPALAAAAARGLESEPMRH